MAPRVALYDSFQTIIESADARVSLSRAYASFLGAGNTFTVPYGIDIDLFSCRHNPDFRRQHGLQGDYVLVAGRLHNTKGQEWAVRALKFLPGTMKLAIVGNTNLFTGESHEDNLHTKAIQRAVEEIDAGDRVVFTGFLKPEELAWLYSGAVATLIPSIWLDPFPTVTLEAMSCQCPVVVSESCGTREIVTDGIEGFVVPRMNPEAIAEAVMKIAPRREQMGRSARQKVENDLNWPRIAAEVMRVLEFAINGKQRP